MAKSSDWQRFSVNNIVFTRQQLLHWANRFGCCCFFNNNEYASIGSQQDCLLGVGTQKYIKLSANTALPQLQQFLDENKGEWFFGHLGYGLKKETEQVGAQKIDSIGFPDVYFFIPEIVVQLVNAKENKAAEAIIYTKNQSSQAIWDEICRQQTTDSYSSIERHTIQARISKNEYISTVHKLQQHILRGDCYEINFCQEFFAEKAQIDALQVYKNLNQVSPNPFSCFYKLDYLHLLCASPERFLLKTGNKLLSQPIKGTAARNLADAKTDKLLSETLRQSSKEQSENVMIVDLVRNDLAKICKKASVKVDELFGIYSFPHVHQMISTISGELHTKTSFSEIIKACFPMGSMTGAPKKKVLELIDKYEVSSRGIFSGTVGYISPEGDFDFNVVIRSIMYNAQSQYLSYLVGGGITWYSSPEKEFEESLLKAQAMHKALEM